MSRKRQRFPLQQCKQCPLEIRAASRRDLGLFSDLFITYLRFLSSETLQNFSEHTTSHRLKFGQARQAHPPESENRFDSTKACIALVRNSRGYCFLAKTVFTACRYPVVAAETL